jgi:DNA-binding LytR/AlgR family response regulator
MIKCIIIDDEQPAINVLEKYIKRIGNLHLLGTATDPVRGLALVKNNEADVVFLDIHMDEMNGIEVMNRLDPSVQVIFCTAYSEFAVESYELNVVDYLMKPISFERIAIAVTRLKSNDNTAVSATSNNVPNDYFFVKADTKGKMIRINLNEIDYIEAKNNYMAIQNGRHTILVYSTMKEIEKYLDPLHFVRIHKSFIIAFSKIAYIENNRVFLKNQQAKIPIGPMYKSTFMNIIHDKLF